MNAETILALKHELRGLESTRDEDLADLLDECQRAKATLDAVQRRLEDARQSHPSMARIAELEERFEAAKDEYLTAWEPGSAKTAKTALGSVTIRESPAITIQNDSLLAKVLLERGLWDAAGASVKLDRKALPLVEAGALPGAGVEVKRSIAIKEAP